jgi:hypothetical protein
MAKSAGVEEGEQKMARHRAEPTYLEALLGWLRGIGRIKKAPHFAGLLTYN